jgi:probable HAF family extracellular repeat protein
MLRLQLCSAVLSLLAAALVQAQFQQYFISTVPVPSDATSIIDVVRLDAQGNAVGNVLKGKQVVPEIWGSSRQTTLPDIGKGVEADGKDYRLDAANAIGAAAGQGVNSTGDPVLIYWDPAHKPSELIGGDVVGGMSDSGAVVGSGGNSALLWETPGSTPATLPVTQIDQRCESYPELCWAEATVVSPNGKYIGGIAGDDFVSYSLRGVLWIDGQEAGAPGEHIAAINDSGLVVGGFYIGIPDEGTSCLTVLGPEHAFASSPTTFIDLGGLPNGDGCFTYATAVNASGVTVGTSSLSFNDYHAAIWVNGRVADLNSLLAPVLPANTELTAAIDVTDSGKILLRAINTKTNSVGYLIATPAVPTRISISSNINPSSYGQQIHLVASVIPDSGAKPTGQVQWYDNGKLLGAARMTTIGTASWEPSTWGPGAHKITASYTGVAPDGSSRSAIFNQTVKATNTRTALFSSANPATHGKSLTLTATVVPTFGTIGGTVRFMSGNTVLGEGTLDGRTKQTRLTTTLNKAGKYTLTAVYLGTANFTKSTSAGLALTVK